MKRLLVAAMAMTQVAWSQYFTTSTGMPVRWNRAEIVVMMDSRGTDDVPGDLEFEAVSRSMDTWNAVACPHPLLKDGGRVSGVSPGLNTKTNLMIWHEDPADWSTPGMNHVIALTTLYFDDRSGIAAKFDMEFADFAYSFTVTDSLALTQTDVENTVTHEFGHVLGLDHSNDREATMYFSASPGDITKRTLAEDDIAGLCTIYFDWSVSHPESSSFTEGGLVVEEGIAPSGGGCRSGYRAGACAWPIAVLGLLVLMIVRHRPPRSSITPKNGI